MADAASAPDAGMTPPGGAPGSNCTAGTTPMSEQLIPNRAPGIVKGSLHKVAPKGMPKNVKKPLHKSKSGGSIRPASGK